MAREWSDPRGYRHLDRPVGAGFVSKVLEPQFVAAHAFSPLIQFDKISKRYKRKSKQTVFKRRPIMFASHRDAAIFGYYAKHLTEALESRYKTVGLDTS